MFRIMHVSPTDYEPSPDFGELQKIADDLNLDARHDGNKTSRWIVVPTTTVGDLFETKQ